MKRSIANRIAALALALVLAGSLVPGAWAARWATTVPTPSMACFAPAGRWAAGSSTPRPPR